MLRKYGLGILLIAIMMAGFRYVYYADPELPDRRLFADAINAFSNNAASSENEFVKKQSISQLNKSFSLKYIGSDKVESVIGLRMSTQNNLVILTFGKGESLLAERSIIMEPYFTNKEMNLASVRWKCIGGSVLLRLRSKACRLGYGIDTREVSAQ